MSEVLTAIATPRKVSTDAIAQQALAAEETETLRAAFAMDRLRRDNIDWVVTLFLAAVHAGALIAPFFFSWTGLATCLLFHWLTCSIGICLGYHRYLAHKSLKLRAPAKFMVLLAGSLSAEGSPLTWAATHRLHHQRSDQEGDPHSPLVGPWWSHVMWLFVRRNDFEQETLYRRYAPELIQDRMLLFFERAFVFLLWGQGLALVAIGALIGGWSMALSMLLWGMCVRMVIAYHSTWFVNSATHLWGYRNYDTRDESRNLWWVAILAYGEGWHNNHHAHPAVAPAGHRWWEVDITWWSIRVLRAVGLAYDVRDQIPRGRGTNEAVAA
ncbi:MAG: fatty acid desaturase [Fuerstiella sp.]|nr:fatty acid desaturase [Fuerstiella sp.]